MATKKQTAEVVLKHPTFDDTFVLVTDGTEDDWKEAGWKSASRKAATEAGIELRPANVSSEPVDLKGGPGTGVDLVSDAPDSDITTSTTT